MRTLADLSIDRSSRLTLQDQLARQIRDLIHWSKLAFSRRSSINMQACRTVERSRPKARATRPRLMPNPTLARYIATCRANAVRISRPPLATCSTRAPHAPAATAIAMSARA